MQPEVIVETSTPHGGAEGGGGSSSRYVTTSNNNSKNVSFEGLVFTQKEMIIAKM